MKVLNSGQVGQQSLLNSVVDSSSCEPYEGMLDDDDDDEESTPDHICCMKGVSSPYSRRTRITKLANALFNVANSAIGSGVLAFPFAFKQSGYLMGTIVTVGAALLLCFSMVVLSRAARKHEAGSYQGLVEAMFGPRAKKVVLVMQTVHCFFTGIAYLMVLSSMIGPLLALGNVSLTRPALIAILAVCVLPLCLLRDIDRLGFTSIIGIVAMLFSCSVVVYFGATDPKLDAVSGLQEAEAFNWQPCAFQVLPIVDFALNCHLTIIPAVADLQPYWPSKNRPGATRFRSLVFICTVVMVLCVALYVPTAILGYRHFGHSTGANVLDSFGSDHVVVDVARACVAVCVFFSYPIPNFVGRKSLVDLMGWSPGGEPLSTPKHVAVTVFYVSCSTSACLMLAVLSIDLDFVLSLVGCTVAVLAQYIFPGCMLLSLGSRYKGLTMLVVGVLMAIFGIFTTISGAVCKGDDGEFCTAMGLAIESTVLNATAS